MLLEDCLPLENLLEVTFEKNLVISILRMLLQFSPNFQV